MSASGKVLVCSSVFFSFVLVVFDSQEVCSCARTMQTRMLPKHLLANFILEVSVIPLMRCTNEPGMTISRGIDSHVRVPLMHAALPCSALAPDVHVKIVSRCVAPHVTFAVT